MKSKIILIVFLFFCNINNVCSQIKPYIIGGGNHFSFLGIREESDGDKRFNFISPVFSGYQFGYGADFFPWKKFDFPLG
ncbi:MAG: hypothetical protein R2879_06790 [Saprospiraceae bacterium]